MKTHLASWASVYTLTKNGRKPLSRHPSICLLRQGPKPLIDRRLHLRPRTVPALFFLLLTLLAFLWFFSVELEQSFRICLIDKQIAFFFFESIVVGIFFFLL